MIQVCHLGVCLEGEGGSIWKHRKRCLISWEDLLHEGTINPRYEQYEWVGAGKRVGRQKHSRCQRQHIQRFSGSQKAGGETWRCVRTQAVSHDSFLRGSVCFCLLRCLGLGSMEPDLTRGWVERGFLLSLNGASSSLASFARTPACLRCSWKPAVGSGC